MHLNRKILPKWLNTESIKKKIKKWSQNFDRINARPMRIKEWASHRSEWKDNRTAQGNSECKFENKKVQQGHEFEITIQINDWILKG
jgi:hypothetical protein